PPLQTDGPRIPDERCARVNTHQEHRWSGDVLPAIDLHTEPVVNQQIPKKLLALQGGFVLAAEIPFAGALGYPAAEPAVLTATLVLHRRARPFGMSPRLLTHFGWPVIRVSHFCRVPHCAADDSRNYSIKAVPECLIRTPPRATVGGAGRFT